MTGNADQKAVARASRAAIEQQFARDAQRRQNAWIVGGVIVVALLISAVALVARSSGRAHTAPPGGALALVQGIPQAGDRLWRASAPVTIKVFGDLECPHCQDFDLHSLPSLVSHDVRGGTVQIQFHALETASQANPDPTAFQRQQVAALAAGRQGRLWQYVQLFYREQGAEATGYVTPAFLAKIAGQIPGLDLRAWSAALSDRSLAEQVTADGQVAQRLGLQATPSLVIRGPHGSAPPIQGVEPYNQIEQAITSVE